MPIELLQEKAIIAEASRFSRDLRLLLKGQDHAARKRHTLLKHYVQAIQSGLDYLQSLENKAEYEALSLHFSESFLPSSQKLMPLIKDDVDSQALHRITTSLHRFFDRELSPKPNRLMLYNTMALALQIEVVRTSKEIEAEADGNPFIRQGQQMTESSGDGENELDKHFLEADYPLGEDDLELTGDRIGQFAHLIEYTATELPHAAAREGGVKEKPRERGDNSPKAVGKEWER